MPYEVESEKLSQKLLNASQLPLILSLALHALVYIYGFPRLLFQPEKNKSDRVQTIELDPSQLSRVPDLNTEAEVPYFNSTPLGEAAPPFALPLPPNFTPSDLPPIPIPPGYRLSDLPSPSSNIELPPLGITDLSALPLPPPIADLESFGSPDGDANAPLTPPEPPQEEPPQPPQPPKIAPPPEPEAEQPPEPKPTPEEIAAVREQKLDKSIRDISASLQKDGATTDAAAQRNYVDWLSKIERAEPIPTTIAGTYPRDACIRRLEGTSVYGVIVDGTNTVVAIDLLKGAEYPVFNEQAARDIKKNKFEARPEETERVRPYTVTVNYEYDADICPSLTLPSIRRKEEAEQQPEPKPAPVEVPAEPAAEEPKPEPTPEETPKPEPEPEPKPEPAAEETPAPEPKPAEEPPAAEPKPEPAAEETPAPEPKPEPEPLPSLRERLQNTPLPSDDTIRERLQKDPLPE